MFLLTFELGAAGARAAYGFVPAAGLEDDDVIEGVMEPP
jgi:hypothetical protein